uniref:Peptidase C14 caspase domain-containing protein n=1 Tax=Plectus sambesii TaxID=2011161 RepID=A0A914WSW6_9BILA
MADSVPTFGGADIFVAWATGWDYKALRESRVDPITNKKIYTGSFFIQELDKAIRTYPDKHILDVMEEVINAVQARFQKDESGECPQVLHSLGKKLYLTKK